MRTSKVARATNETDIKLSLNLDGSGISNIDTGIGFFDHMLELFTSHGRFDLDLTCKGDIHVDGHHSIEDIGICLGTAFDEALGNAGGITRYGNALIPMDEALVSCAVDLCGRSHLSMTLMLPDHTAGDAETELFEEFLQSFVRKSGATVHVRMLDGKNSHHILEACFKALARALRAAVKIDPELGGKIPSTKGVL